jgi:hypothetical protein
MLLHGYRLEIFNSKCNPGAMTVHCFTHLDQDVSEALPYLNTVLGGFALCAATDQSIGSGPNGYTGKEVDLMTDEDGYQEIQLEIQGMT